MSMLGRNHLIKDSLMASLAAPIRTESSINSSCDNQILSFGRLAGEKKWGWLLLWLYRLPQTEKYPNRCSQLVFNWDEL